MTASAGVSDGHDGPDVRAEASVALRTWLESNWDADLSLRAWWERLADSGWSAPTWPTWAGGRGLGRWGMALVNDEFRRNRIPGPPGGHGLNMAGPTLIDYGNRSQQRRHLRPILTGESVWCQLFSEPGAGSDLPAATARARPVDTGWLVTGQKVWSSHAHYADFGMLLARTGSTVSGRAGLSWFILPMRQPGVVVRPLRQMNGQQEFNEVFLDNAEVCPEHLVGTLDKGWEVARATLNHERANLTTHSSAIVLPRDEVARTNAGDALAVAARSVMAPRVRGARWLIAYAQQHGQSQDAVLRQDLARLYTLNEIQRVTGMRAGSDPSARSTMKLAATRAIRLAADIAMRMQGAAATLDGRDALSDGQAQRMTLWAPAVSIAGGTDEIQRNTISERILELPREPRK